MAKAPRRGDDSTCRAIGPQSPRMIAAGRSPTCATQTSALSATPSLKPAVCARIMRRDAAAQLANGGGLARTADSSEKGTPSGLKRRERYDSIFCSGVRYFLRSLSDSLSSRIIIFSSRSSICRVLRILPAQCHAKCHLPTSRRATTAEAPVRLRSQESRTIQSVTARCPSFQPSHRTLTPLNCRGVRSFSESST